ncbi:glycosyltransferase [Litorimonas sp. WD9-15]|uniref:glycosyltransferase n=1 Tax=Litorimonas sp. WD9-15 TaxID=3418716 RepID=UPI003CFD7473
MINILMLSGPALGHVARLSLAAEALLKTSDIKVDFVVPGFCQHLTLPESAGCRVQTIRIEDESRKFPALAYAEQVERLFDTLNPDIIVQDCSPLRWLPATRFPECPRVVITNAFLIGPPEFETHQVSDFAARKTQLNKMRAERGLYSLNSAYDLYLGTKTLLSDPTPLVESLSPWPTDIENCGPLCLEQGADLPETIQDLSDIALFSMGSTGGLESYQAIAGTLQASPDFGATVYVGSRAEEAKATGCYDFCFDWLPLSSVLKKARVVITHGGTGSTYLALSNGVPVLISPKHKNHAVLAQCLSDLGVGARLEDQSSLDQLPDMKATLRSYGTAFDHKDAPMKHAKAILEALSC